MNARSIEQALTGVCVLVFLGAVLFILTQLLGCEPKADTMPIENALAVKQYDDELVACQQAARQKPKEQRFEAYADCEQNVSRRMCEASSELREHWIRCKELAQ